MSDTVYVKQTKLEHKNLGVPGNITSKVVFLKNIAHMLKNLITVLAIALNQCVLTGSSWTIIFPSMLRFLCLEAGGGPAGLQEAVCSWSLSIQ
jgi:hypothetical protein